MSPQYENLEKEGQLQLEAFLDAELGIADTFAHSALIARDSGHADHCKKAKEAAEKAVSAIQYFSDRVQNQATRVEIMERLAALEQLISTI